MPALSKEELAKWSKANKLLMRHKIDYAAMKASPSLFSQFVKKVKVALISAGMDNKVSTVMDTIMTGTKNKTYSVDTEYLPDTVEEQLYALLTGVLDEQSGNIIDADEEEGLYGTHILSLLTEEFIHVSGQKIADLQRELFEVDPGAVFAIAMKKLSSTIADLKAVDAPVTTQTHMAALISAVSKCKETSALGKSVALWAIDTTPKKLRSNIEDWCAANCAADEDTGEALAAREVECYVCGEYGHISRQCRKNYRNRRKNRQKPGNKHYKGCYICGSKKHLKRDCKKAADSDDDDKAGAVFAEEEEVHF